MLTLKYKTLLSLILISSLSLASKASAGLYGFTSGTPLSQEEKILQMSAPPEDILNYRALMRQNLEILINYAKENKPDFQILLHDCDEILYKSLWEYHLLGYRQAKQEAGAQADPSFLSKSLQDLSEEYLPEETLDHQIFDKIDGVVYNNLYCSQRKIDSFLKNTNKKIATISYCATDKSYDQAAVLSTKEKVLFYGFENPQTAFQYISKQPIINENAHNIFNLREAENISFLINDSHYNDKADMIKDIRDSNYDVVVINPLFHDTLPFSKEEVVQLQYKKSGPKRLIIALQNVSEAFKSHYYWQEDWQINSPKWLKRASLVNKNAYITAYWSEDWQKIVSNYFKSIVDSGYDGVFFTGINNHLYFESQTPLE